MQPTSPHWISAWILIIVVLFASSCGGSTDNGSSESRATSSNTSSSNSSASAEAAAPAASSASSDNGPFLWETELNRCELFRSSILFTKVRGVGFIPNGDYAIGDCDGSGFAFFNLSNGDTTFIDDFTSGAKAKAILFDGTFVAVSSTAATATSDTAWTATYIDLKNGSTETYSYPREKAPSYFDVDGWASYGTPQHEWFRNDEQTHIEDAARRDGFSDYFTSGRAVLMGFDDTIVVTDLGSGPIWQTSIPGLDDMWRVSPDTIAVDTFKDNQRDVFLFDIESGREVTPPARYIASDFDAAYQFGDRRFVWNNGFLAEVNSSDSELWSRASRSECEFAGDVDFGLIVLCGRTVALMGS